jgi:L-asparaginase
MLSTGGTIASRIDPASGLAVPVASSGVLLESIPGLAEHAQVEALEVFCVASPHIGPDQWRILHDQVQHQLTRPQVSGVVISHGTALLEETAWFLDLTLSTAKPVVLVGAQRNASQPDTDGPRNLFDAIRTAVNTCSRDLGVLVVMNQQIHAARTVRKNHSFDVNAFESGEWGQLGHVAVEGVQIMSRPTRRIHVALNDTPLPGVAIVPMYAGADGGLVEAAAERYQGLVIQAIGAGHVNPDVFKAVNRALDKGVPVWITTRLSRGGARPCYGFIGSSKQLLDAGAVIAGDLSAWKARILLMLALQSGNYGQIVKDFASY